MELVLDLIFFFEGVLTSRIGDVIRDLIIVDRSKLGVQWSELEVKWGDMIRWAM